MVYFLFCITLGGMKNAKQILYEIVILPALRPEVSFSLLKLYQKCIHDTSTYHLSFNLDKSEILEYS